MSGFLLFAGVAYYPIGGWDDLVGSFATVEEARNAARSSTVESCGEDVAPDWYHIVSLETLAIVEQDD